MHDSTFILVASGFFTIEGTPIVGEAITKMRLVEGLNWGCDT